MTDEELEQLVRPDVQQIIQSNRNEDPHNFALKFHANPELPVRAIAEQIACYQKAVQKLPDLVDRQLILHPVSLQQSTGSHLAEIKPKLLGMQGDKLLDMTGGLGIDTIFQAKHFTEAVYCESNTLLSKIASYNFQKLQLRNIIVINADSIEALANYPDYYFDWIYIDPSRRTENRRTISMEDSSPNVVQHQDLLLRKARHIAIKLSPVIEVSDVLKKLHSLETIFVISVDGECKEVTCTLNATVPSNHESALKAILLNSASNDYETIVQENPTEKRPLSTSVMQYFYEPDAAIIKARLSVELTKKINDCYFINNQTDYLTSSLPIPKFPGRSFKVIISKEFTGKSFKNYLKRNVIRKVNVARRDFPMTPDQIKKKFQLGDGGTDYFFFTKDHRNSNIFIHAVKPE